MNTPRHPASDVVIGNEVSGWYSYGPRIWIDADTVDAPKDGEAPQFWSVYRWLPDDEEWRWIIDIRRMEDARSLTRRLVLDPNYQPEPEQVAA